MLAVFFALLIPSFSNAFEPSQCPKEIVLNYEEFVGRDMADLMTEKQYIEKYFGGVL